MKALLDVTMTSQKRICSFLQGEVFFHRATQLFSGEGGWFYKPQKKGVFVFQSSSKKTPLGRCEDCMAKSSIDERFTWLNYLLEG